MLWKICFEVVMFEIVCLSLYSLVICEVGVWVKRIEDMCYEVV